MLERLEKLALQWKRLAAMVKGQEYIEFSQLLEIFKATHRAISDMDGLDTVPRKALQVIMLMDEFTYFAAMSDENYLGEICSGLYRLNYALKYEFFKGNYQSEFFWGELPDGFKSCLPDLENISLEAFVILLRDEISDEE